MIAARTDGSQPSREYEWPGVVAASRYHRSYAMRMVRR